MITKSKLQTQKLASRLAKKLLRTSNLQRQTATVIALSGNLGSGKTTFAQGFLKALGVRRGVTSPTFVIMRRYSIKTSNVQQPTSNFIYHFDLYRIKKLKELLHLGFKKIINDPENIVLIEWPELVNLSGQEKILPKNTVWIKFRHGKREGERNVKIK